MSSLIYRRLGALGLCFLSHNPSRCGWGCTAEQKAPVLSPRTLPPARDMLVGPRLRVYAFMMRIPPGFSCKSSALSSRGHFNLQKKKEALSPNLSLRGKDLKSRAGVSLSCPSGKSCFLTFSGAFTRQTGAASCDPDAWSISQGLVPLPWCELVLEALGESGRFFILFPP